MSIRYKKVQNKIKGTKTYMQWYGRAVIMDTISTEKIAKEMAHATTITEADARAFLCELAHVMNEHLTSSDAIQLDGIGLFKPALKTTTTVKKEDFGASRIKGFRVLFQPETVFTPTGVNDKGNRIGFRTKKLLEGATAKCIDEDVKATTTDAGAGA